MPDNRMPTTMSYETAEGWFPFMTISADGERLKPNKLLCLPSVPTYEWIADGYYHFFRALPRSGGKMADYIEVADG